MDLENDANGNPSSNPETSFAVQVVTTSPNDSNWLNKWVNGSGNPSATEVWLTDAQLDALVLQGLTLSTNYGVKVKAKNQDGDETGLSAEGQGTTSSDSSPPTPNPMTFASAPANDSATQISMTATTGSDATPPVEYLFTNNNSTCGANAGTNGTSSSWQQSTSYSDSGLDANKCYGYTVTSRDSLSNTGTASGISITYTSANTPGTPTLSGATQTTLNLTNAENGNPSSNPTTSFAVQVVTTSPNDSNWLNKWVNGSGNPSATAVWLTDAQLDALVLQGLTLSTTYGVKVKAKNQDGDETSLSAEGQGTTSSDSSPPTPNPMTWASGPANDSATQISMTSTTGSDATPPVEYLFTNNNSTCGANAGTNGTSSSWQSSTSYSDTGLDPNKCYGYTVTARDSVTPTPNTGTASGISITYTSANTPGTPTLSGATLTTLNLTNAQNGNPSSNPTTSFAVQVTYTSPTDLTWLNKWVNGSGNPSATAVWLTDAELDALVLHGLASSTTYGVKVKAKNQDGDETGLGAEGRGTTLGTVGVYRSIGMNAGTLYNTGTASISNGSATVTFSGGASLPELDAVGAVGTGDRLVVGGGDLLYQIP